MIALLFMLALIVIGIAMLPQAIAVVGGVIPAIVVLIVALVAIGVITATRDPIPPKSAEELERLSRVALERERYGG